MRGKVVRAGAGPVVGLLLWSCSPGAADEAPGSFEVDVDSASAPTVEDHRDDFDRLYASVLVPADSDERRLVEAAAGAVAELRSEHDYIALELSLRADEPAMEPGLRVGYVVDAPGLHALPDDVRNTLEDPYTSPASAAFQAALEVDRSPGDYQGFVVLLTLEQPDWEQQPSVEQWQRYEQLSERYADRHESTFSEGIVWRDDEVELAREVTREVADEIDMDADELWTEFEQTRDWVLDRSTTSMECSPEGDPAAPTSFDCEAR